MIRRPSFFLHVVAAVVACASVICQAQPQGLLTRHVRDAVVNGQAPLVGHLPASQQMRLVLVLPVRDQAGLDSFLKDLYNPASPQFRKFLTVEEFTARFGATPGDYNAVLQFAENSGLKVVATSLNRRNVDVTGSVAAIEKAFNVTLGVYQLPTENRTFYAPDREPTVNLPFQLWRISGLDNYSIPKPALMRRSGRHEREVKSNTITGSCPEGSYCGSDMRGAYYGGSALDGTGQTLGLLEYVGTDLVDFNTYYTNAGQTAAITPTLVSTDGTPTTCTAAEGCDDTEQTLDMTQALGMAPNLSSLVVYVGSSDTAIFNAMATATPLDAQLSSSWSWFPADASSDLPYFDEFEAQGQNLFQAAGDGGAWTASGANAEIYPADSVYVTSVGGTDLSTAGPNGAWTAETTWQYGGGGISPDHFLIPSWQVAAAAVCTSCSQLERNGPDVAAEANFDFYVCADQTTCTANEYGGTSFAAPMWAGYLALVNQQEANGGAPSLGFINPALYNIGAGAGYDTAFHDITTGSNGFNAETGYDLATGWGSPNGSGLIDALALSSTTTALVSSANPSSIGQSVTFTATVTGSSSGSLTGSVAFNDGSTLLSSVPVSAGIAAYTTSSLSAGAHLITAVYSGDSGDSGSTSSVVTQTVNINSTTTALGASANPVNAGQSVTLTATVAASAGSPTGTVTFMNGSTSMGTSPVSAGVATLSVATAPTGSVTALGPGTYPITAVYSGDTNDGGSTSTVVSLNVQYFTVPASATITVSAPGQSGMATLTITPEGGFSSIPTFACASGLPTGATCAFTNVSATGATLTMSTTAPSSDLRHAALLGRNKALLFALLCPGFLGLVSAGARKRTLRGLRLLALISVVAFCSMWLACGGNSTPTTTTPTGGTPAGTSMVNVTATSGSIVGTTVVTLTVQ
jgi:subtilase family serine protease